MRHRKTQAVSCPTCEQQSVVELQAHYDWVEEDSTYVSTVFSFWRCSRCCHPFVSRHEEYDLPDGDDVGIGPLNFIFPVERSVGTSVPKKLAESFGEASTCFQVQSYTACAIMCRRTLEGICAHHNVKSGNLAGKLKKLREEGIIEQRLFEWAETLREVGNEAAHDADKVVSKEDARDLLDFSRALLEYVFAYRASFEKFRARRMKRDEAVALEDASRKHPTA